MLVRLFQISHGAILDEEPNIGKSKERKNIRRISKDENKSDDSETSQTSETDAPTKFYETDLYMGKTESDDSENDISESDQSKLILPQSTLDQPRPFALVQRNKYRNVSSGSRSKETHNALVFKD